MDKLQNNHRNKPDNHRHTRITEQNETDLAILLSTDLYVGSTSISLRQKPAEVMRFCYEINGQRYIRNYLSPLSWRAVMLFALAEDKAVAIHDMGR